MLDQTAPLSVWLSLPNPIRETLLLGGNDSFRLKCFSKILIESIHKDNNHELLFNIASDMMQAAWEEDPCNISAAGDILLTHGQRHFLSKGVLKVVEQCTKTSEAVQASVESLYKLILNKKYSSAKAVLERLMKSEPDIPFWIHYATYIGMRSDNLDWYASFLTRSKGLPSALRFLLLGDILFAKQQWLAALDAYKGSNSLLPIPLSMVRMAEALMALGREDEALPLFYKAFRMRPWQIGTALRLYDILQGYHKSGDLPAGQGVILLYSWNHAEDLNLSLEALSSSQLGNTKVLVLNNGSTDHTEKVVRHWESKMQGRMRVITLPVNVGAPAARNWLLQEPEVKVADWAVFLDDDAIVPPNWLGMFGTAMRAYPEGEIFGCRVIDAILPLTAQSIDLHFESPLMLAEKKEDTPPQLNLFQPSSKDFGQFSYMRPCVSVTGCCHLFTRKNMDKIGGFDLRFSPSQFDDFDRDLRSAIAGTIHIYQGNLQVIHRKSTGTAVHINPWQWANAYGNLEKLRHTHSKEALDNLQQKDMEALWQHLQKAFAVIEKHSDELIIAKG